MSVPFRNVFQQGPVVAALINTAYKSMRQKKATGIPEPPVCPGPEIVEICPARPSSLIDDYIRHVGGDPSGYRGTVPFHLFPQWAFPIFGKLLSDLPYDLTAVLNAGCSVQIREPLPTGVPLHLRGRLERVDADDRRVLLTQRIVTGTSEVPEALVVDQTAIVVFPRPKDAPAGKRERARIPADVREIGRFRAHARSGLEFAMLTGDFNPLHWIAPYARAFGHPSPILHGFSTMARAIEFMNRNLFAGDVSRLREITVRFSRPLRLPAEVGIYLGQGGAIYAGNGVGGPAYLYGNVTY